MKFIAICNLLVFTCCSALAQQQESVATVPLSPDANFSSRGSKFNPDISMNALILYNRSDSGIDYLSTEPNGMQLQEVELQMTADVDPYWRFFGLLSVHPEYEVVAAQRELEYVIEPEEVYAESLSLPFVTLKFGKHKIRFGKQNQLHTHALPFIDPNLNVSALLGEEGLNDTGAAVSALLPTSWFSEFTVSAIKGEAEGLEYFRSRSNDDVVAVGRFVNLFDLSDSSTFEVGLSGATGENSTTESTRLAGADMTFKWRPVEGGKYQAASVSGELIARTEEDASNQKFESIGTAAWIQYQFARRWWAQARMEWLKYEDANGTVDPEDPDTRTNKWTALVGFVPSEFSAVRMQYAETDISSTDDVDRSVMLQLNYSIGAHPAHTY